MQYGMFYMDWCEQSGEQESLFKTHSPVHQTAHTNASKTQHTTYTPVFLRRNPCCSKHVGDIINEILIYKIVVGQTAQSV